MLYFFSKITKSDEYKPDMISMDLNLKSGVVKYRDHDSLQPEKQTELIAERGDRITVCAVKQISSVVADNEVSILVSYSEFSLIK